MLRTFIVSIAAALLFAAPARAAEVGLLIMQVSTVNMNNEEQRSGGWPGDWELLNIETKDWYKNRWLKPLIAEVPVGIYCLYAVTPARNAYLRYCNEPYFRVLPGQVNNAGHWRMGFDPRLGTFKLLGSLESLDELLLDAVKAEPELLEKYGLRLRK